MKHLPVVFLLVLLTGCSSGCSFPVPKTPDQIVFSAGTAYEEALVLAIKYAKLPRCEATDVALGCSDPATVLKIEGISDATWTSIQAAQKTVRTPGFGDNVLQSAATAAKNAVDAFISATSKLPVK